MHPVLRNTFGGLTKQYYFRQFLFGLTITLIVLVALYFHLNYQSKNNIDHIAFSDLTLPVQIKSAMTILLNTLLYPFARFVYESIVEFIMGDNILITNVIIALPVKFITMSMCWVYAIFIAPLGLIFLFFYHRKPR